MEIEFITFISQFGFPIALCVYLIITRDKIISQNTEALTELKYVIKECYKEK